MEIKTTKEIEVESERLFDSDNYDQLTLFDKKKWVGLEDVFNVIKDMKILNHKGSFTSDREKTKEALLSQFKEEGKDG